MDQPKEDKLTSYRSIIAWANAYAIILAAFVLLNAKVVLFKAAVALIEEKLDLFMGASKGMAAFKAALRSTMVAKLFPIANAVSHFCAANGDPETAAYCRVTFSQLMYEMRDTELAVFAKKVMRKALSLSADLADYKLTQEKLTAADDSVNLYDEVIGKKERAVEVRKAALTAMDKAFDDADLILHNDMDMLIELIKDENKSAYDEYWGAREIKTMGVRHRQEENPSNPA